MGKMRSKILSQKITVVILCMAMATVSTGSICRVKASEAETKPKIELLPQGESVEDEAGNVSTVEKEIPLLIYEAYVDDMGYDDMGYDDMGYDEMGDMYYEDMENAGPSVGLIIGLCVGAAVIIAIVVIIIVVNVKKKKKRLAEQKELEDFADDNLQ